MPVAFSKNMTDNQLFKLSLIHIFIPQNVTEKDLDFITLYIENMLPTFISNLKEELEK